MTNEIMITYGALCFLVVLMLVYFKKQISTTASTIFYKLLIYTTLIYSITEIIYVVLIKNNIISSILFIVHFLFSIIWLYLIYSYIEAVIVEQKGKKYFEYFKKSILSIFMTIIFIISIIAYIIIALKTKFNPTISFFSSTRLIFYLVLYILILIITLVKLNINKKILNQKDVLIKIITLTILFIILQSSFREISFIPFMYYTIVALIYLFVENPELKLINELTNTKEEIEKSNKAKTDFLSNMGYEIKIPMTLIVSLCDELNNMSVFNESLFRENMSQIAASGNSMLDIVNNILDISKIETGKSTLQEKEYRTNSLLTDILNIAKSKIGNKNVKLVVNIDQNISSSFNGDYAKIYQILLNIISNSAKYTEVGKITFTLTSTKDSGIEKLLFKISDTGTGIKEEEKEKVFEKGTKLGNATNGELEGTGLGLTITKEYIDLLGGKIWFDSQYRVGTTFYIEIPQKIVDAKPIATTAVEETKEKEKIDCSGKTVLIVDDNQLNIKVAKRLLETYKFTIESVTSGKDCIYKIKEGTKYDGIFMDHMMPEMDGIETLQILKKLNDFTLPPIIALTANAVAGMREMYLNEGFDEYLSKPINTKELDRIINLFYGEKETQK